MRKTSEDCSVPVAQEFEVGLRSSNLRGRSRNRSKESFFYKEKCSTTVAVEREDRLVVEEEEKEAYDSGSRKVPNRQHLRSDRPRDILLTKHSLDGRVGQHGAALYQLGLLRSYPPGGQDGHPAVRLQFRWQSFLRESDALLLAQSYKPACTFAVGSPISLSGARSAG